MKHEWELSKGSMCTMWLAEGVGGEDRSPDRDNSMYKGPAV